MKLNKRFSLLMLAVAGIVSQDAVAARRGGVARKSEPSAPAKVAAAAPAASSVSMSDLSQDVVQRMKDLAALYEDQKAAVEKFFAKHKEADKVRIARPDLLISKNSLESGIFLIEGADFNSQMIADINKSLGNRSLPADFMSFCSVQAKMYLIYDIKAKTFSLLTIGDKGNTLEGNWKSFEDVKAIVAKL